MIDISFLPVFSKRQVRSFHENGYLIFDPGFKASVLDEVIEQLTPLYGPSLNRADGLQFGHGTRVQDAHHRARAARRVATAPRIMRGLEQLFGRKAHAFQVLNFPIGTEQKAHSDTIHFNSMPSGYMVGVWVALEDIDADNGPLVYYPGSHKLPEYRMQDFGLRPSYDDYGQYEQAIERLIGKYDLKPEYGQIKKGQAIIWHANLLHGGSRQKDKTRTRHSQVTHYFFEGCRYFTPMNSTPFVPAFRDPNWIKPIPTRLDKWKRKLGLATPSKPPVEKGR
ncbi:MAG: phytanoyl-CoA dioxygenase [Alphaproteobacteria bacterium]|nr:MAG: phytanoyl-CoA dioxygenase [Alphaproteobacteria bacterium]